MPLRKGSSRDVISANIADQMKGPQHAQTAAKFGEDRANKQAVAVAYAVAKRGKNKGKSPAARLKGLAKYHAK